MQSHACKYNSFSKYVHPNLPTRVSYPEQGLCRYNSDSRPLKISYHQSKLPGVMVITRRTLVINVLIACSCKRLYLRLTARADDKYKAGIAGG